jgi:hypothetical protein
LTSFDHFDQLISFDQKLIQHCPFPPQEPWGGYRLQPLNPPRDHPA